MDISFRGIKIPDIFIWIIRNVLLFFQLINDSSIDFHNLNRSANYHGESNFSALLTPITFLISYFNSAFNPLLYAFLSRNFRKGMREIILCSFKKSNNKSIQQRIPLHVSKSVFWQIFPLRLSNCSSKPTTYR